MSSELSVFSKYQTVQRPFVVLPKSTVKTESNSTKRLGIAIASTSLLAGFGVLALMKGMPKGFYNSLDKFSKFLEDKAIKINNKTNFSLKMIRGAQFLTNKMKAIYNMTPLKDVLFQKLMDTTSWTKKASNYITKTFENISVNTVKKHYSKTLRVLDELTCHLDDVNKKILAQNPSAGDVIKNIERRTGKVVTGFENFRMPAIKQRYQNMNKSFDKLSDRVWNNTYGYFLDAFKSKNVRQKFGEVLRNKKTYETFISEELVAPDKMNLTKNINALRRVLTNDIMDNCKATDNIIKSIDNFIDPKDITARGFMKSVKTLMREYKNISGMQEAVQREAIIAKVVKNLEGLSAQVTKSSSYDPKIVTQVSSSIEDLSRILTQNKKGEIQEILTEYKKVLPRAEYFKLKKDVYKFVKSLDKSIDLENDKFFDKLRDLRIGSAPTDVLGFITPFALIGWGLRRAENKDEKISVGLRYGLPVLGTIGISLYCTAGLISGGAALAVGLGSGFVINRICSYIDDLRLNYKEKISNLTMLAQKASLMNKVNTSAPLAAESKGQVVL